MMMFNDTNALPFRVDYPENQNPSFPDAKQFMGHVQIQNVAQLNELLIACATEIYDSANKNHIRMFMYNQCANSNWCNDAFLEFVNFVLAYVNFATQSGMRGTLQEFVSYAAKLFASRNIANYPALQSYCSQEAYAEAAGHVNSLTQIINQIAASTNLNTFANANRNLMGGGNFGGQVRQSGVGLNMNNVMTSFLGKNDSSGGGGIGRWGQGPDDTFKMTPTPAINAVNTRAVAMEKTTPPPISQEPQSINGEVSADVGWSKWFPTLKFPYIPAVRFRDYVLTFKKESGLYIPVIRERVKTMDFAAHRIPTSYGFLPREYGHNVDPDNAVTLILKGAQAIGEKVPEEIRSMVVNPVVLLDVGINQVWFDVAIDRMALAKDGADKLPRVYHATSHISENPIIDKTSHDKWILDIRNSRTLSELRVRIVSALDIIPKALWKELDRRLTDKLHRVIRTQLAIPTLTFDSFTEDYEDVLNILGTKYGENIKELFLKHQIEIIRSVVNVLDPEAAKTLTDITRGSVEEPDFKVTYLSRKVSITMLDFNVNELSIEVPKTVGVAVIQDQSPEFHHLISEIIKLHQDEEFPCEAHYVRTTDFFTFEIAKGYLGSDFNVMILVDG